MKNKIAFGMTACGVMIAGFGAMGLGKEGQAGFALAVKITVVGLAIAGVGQLIIRVEINMDTAMDLYGSNYAAHYM